MPPPSDDNNFEGVNGILQMAAIVPARAKFIGETIVSVTLSSLTLGMTFGLFGAALLPTGPVVPFMVGAWVGQTFGLFHHYRSLRNNAMRYAHFYPTIMAHAMFVEHGVLVPHHVIASSQQRLDDEKQQQQQQEEEERQDTGSTFIKPDTGSGMVVVPQTSRPSSGGVESSSGSSSINVNNSRMALDQWIQASGMKMMNFAILASQYCRSDIEDLRRQERDKLVADHYERYLGGNSSTAASDNETDEVDD